MSTPQGNSACRISVDPSTADVLRIETKKVLMFNHDPFEDFMDYVPTKQLALADVYRDATAVIDALGWDPEMVPHTDSIEVPADLRPRRAVARASLRSAGYQPRPPHRYRRRQPGQRRGDARDPCQPPRRRSAQPRL
jgi:hypothetical protein